jgi:crotonobetainyl-CoA:carnitine CoA-transferase CaiB-like acyl-CoA transferase
MTEPVPTASNDVLGLAGVRVLDVTTNVAGPFATQILGDLGADVVKVERPGGDDTRGWGPPNWPRSGESVTFSSLNRNKRSIALDLTAEQDRAVFERLLVGADVVVQSMRPGAFERLGYGYERLREINPAVVYAELRGFGPVGPRAEEPAYDPLMQAFSGLMSLTGEAGRAPARIPVSILDKGTGMWTAIGILNALRRRDETGTGAHVVTSLLETALTWESTQLTGYLANGEVPEPLGSATAGIAPYQAYATADAHIVIAAGNQRLWQKLCAALDRAELVDDPRFADNSRRFEQRAALEEELTATLRRRPAQEWVATLAQAGVPASVIRRVDEVVADEQVRALGALERVPHPIEEDYTLVHTPILTDGSRFPLRSHPPALDGDGAALREDA